MGFPDDVFKSAEFAAGMSGVNKALVSAASYRAPELPVITNPLVEAVHDNLASEFHSRIKECIEAFDSGLDDKSETGLMLVAFGQSIVIHLRSVGCFNPSLMLFQGVTESGSPVELIQHVTQISVLLMSLPRKNPEEPKKPIGFHLGAESDKSSE
jgi:hypothetical protein